MGAEAAEGFGWCTDSPMVAEAGGFGCCTNSPMEAGAAGDSGDITEIRDAVMPVSRVGHGDGHW